MSGAAIGLLPIEAAQLAELITQFIELLADADTRADPALARLVPDAYRDDPAAAREFRRLTEADLLGRRVADAQAMRESLASVASRATDAGSSRRPVRLELDAAQSGAWMRTLAALRLVLASRLGIDDEDDHDDDPRFGVYDWLGYRLELLVQALDRD